MKTDAETKRTVIAILTSARDSEAGLGAGRSMAQHPAEGHGLFGDAYAPSASVSPDHPAGRQALTAATYAMTLFHMLAAEFEAACPDVDVQAFLQRRALEIAAGDGEAA